MEVYRLKVTIVGLKGVHRIIEATANSTFDDLHEAIFSAFDREDEHMYSFFLTGKDTQNTRTIYDSPEITHPMGLQEQFETGTPKADAVKTKLGDVSLAEKFVFHYLFDFGDEWWHLIRVESIGESESKKKQVKIVERIGESPPQYEYNEDYDEDDDDDE